MDRDKKKPASDTERIIDKQGQKHEEQPMLDAALPDPIQLGRQLGLRQLIRLYC